MLVHHLAMNSRTPHLRLYPHLRLWKTNGFSHFMRRQAKGGGREDFGNQAVRNPLRMIRFLECDHSQKIGQPLVAATVAAFFE